MVVEDFARAVIEHVLDGRELLMADLAQVHALGQKLAHQAVGVFIGAAQFFHVKNATFRGQTYPFGMRSKEPKKAPQIADIFPRSKLSRSANGTD